MPHAYQARILVVEDELRYFRVIKIALEANQYEVLAAHSGDKALELVAIENPDLILLDIVMPGMDGYEVCRRIREFSHIPIIFLTALDDVTSIVQGLDSGADDYIAKPFNMRELLARLRVHLRRTDSMMPTAPAALCVGELRADFARNRIYCNGQELKLTRTEYDLLALLMHHTGEVMTPGELLEEVWGSGRDHDTQLLWQVIHRLRRKIEPDPANPTYIHTRSGVGYIFEYQGPNAPAEDSLASMLPPRNEDPL